MSTQSETAPVTEKPIEAPATASAPNREATQPATSTAPTTTPAPQQKGGSLSGHDFGLIIIALFFPFVTMGIKKGWCTGYMWACLLLELLLFFHLPATVWAIYVVLQNPEPTVYDIEKNAGASAPATAPAPSAAPEAAPAPAPEAAPEAATPVTETEKVSTTVTTTKLTEPAPAYPVAETKTKASETVAKSEDAAVTTSEVTESEVKVQTKGVSESK